MTKWNGTIANIKPQLQRNEHGTHLLSVTSTNCRSEVVFGKMIIGIFNFGDHIIIFPSRKRQNPIDRMVS